MWLANLDPVAVVRELRPNALSKGEMDWYRQIYHEAENARRRKKKDPL